MNIDLSNYFQLHASSRVPKLTLTIHDTGRVKFSCEMMKLMSNDEIDVHISKDYRNTVVIQDGQKREIKLKKDSSFMAKGSLSQFDPKKITFPIVYEMEKSDEEGIWTGTRRLITKTSKSKSKTNRSIEELVQ